MSRVGRVPIPLPEGVKVQIQRGSIFTEGPRGRLARSIPERMLVELKDNQILVKRPSDDRLSRSLHGLTRTLIANLIEGVTKGFQKTLVVVGIGYKVQLQGNDLILQLGFSHPVRFLPPTGVKLMVEGGTRITVSGIDKELVGEVAARIRALKPPEPYKGKGIKYVDEYIRRKAGKTGVGTGV